MTARATATVTPGWPSPFPAARGLLRRVLHVLALRLILREGLHRIRMLGLSLEIPPSVFHPRFAFTSRFLAAYLETIDLRGRRVLDMGCGSGIQGCVAARKGAMVTAVDINPRAVFCTRRNAAANGVQDRISALESDLFAGLPAGGAYGYIVWNPPFYADEPADTAQRAWAAGKGLEVIARFADGAAARLLPGGSVLMVLSSESDERSIIGLFAGFVPELVLSGRKLFETLNIYRLTPKEPGLTAFTSQLPPQPAS